MAKVAKYSDKDLGYDENQWYEKYEKPPVTEAQKMHATLKEVGLGDLWAGPQPAPPSPPAPLTHKAGKSWEKLVSTHYGLTPRSVSIEHSSVREAVADFASKTHESDPRDACKYLAIEEHRCLLAAHSHGDPKHAATSCLKYFEEWKQCTWDQFKFNEGLSYIEGPQIKKAYRFAPNHKFA